MARVRYHGAAIFVAALLSSGLAAGASSDPLEEPVDHVARSTPIVKAWREIPVGSPVYTLDDAAGTKDWLESARIELITVQTGVWHVLVEDGYSVFRIYPYLAEDSPQPRVYQGIVIKVYGNLLVDDLKAAIRGRQPSIKIDEYDVFGDGSVAVQRTSRPHCH